MFQFQSHLIFPVHAVPPAGRFPPSATRLSVPTPDGQTLHGVHIAPDGPNRDRTLVLGFGGNAWNGQDVAEYLHELYPDVDVVTFHFRGYSPSTGSPSADALIADAPLVYDAAVEEVRAKRIIAVGFSIGTGVAAQLSEKRKLDGLILVTPFNSLKAVAQAMYPWLPIGPFFEHEIDAAGPLRTSKRESGSLQPNMITSFRVSGRKPCARSSLTWFTIAPSAVPGTMTFMHVPIFTRRCTRH